MTFRLRITSVLLLATASLHANDIVIYGTAQVASGGRDSNYQIISDSTGLLTGGGQAFVVTHTALGWGSVPGGKWIAARADQGNDTVNSTLPGTCCVGTTKYTTRFGLDGVEPSTAVLTMSVLADNFVDVYLNGVHVFSPTTQMYTNSVNIVLKAGPNVPFISGQNILEFDVANQGGPGGLNVSIAGTADPARTGPPKLEVSPTFVTAATVAGSTQADIVGIYARNTGAGGPQKLAFSVVASPSCSSVGSSGFFGIFTPTTTVENSPAMRIQAFSVDPGGGILKPGFYRTNMRLTMSSLAQPDQNSGYLRELPADTGVSRLLRQQGGTLFHRAGRHGHALDSVDSGSCQRQRFGLDRQYRQPDRFPDHHTDKRIPALLLRNQSHYSPARRARRRLQRSPWCRFFQSPHPSAP